MEMDQYILWLTTRIRDIVGFPDAWLRLSNGVSYKGPFVLTNYTMLATINNIQVEIPLLQITEWKVEMVNPN